MTLTSIRAGGKQEVARPEGLEPPAYRFEACRSIQLSYGRPDWPTDHLAN